MTLDTYALPFDEYIFSVIVDLLNIENDKILLVTVGETFSSIDFLSRFPWLLETPSDSVISLTKFNRNTIKEGWSGCVEVTVFLSKDKVLKACTSDGFYLFSNNNPSRMISLLYVKKKSIYIIPPKHASRIEACFKQRMSHKNVFDIISFDG